MNLYDSEQAGRMARQVRQLLDGMGGQYLTQVMKGLVEKQSQPGGVIYEQNRREDQAVQEFIRLHPETWEDGSLKQLLCVLCGWSGISAQIGGEMFRSGLLYMVLAMYLSQEEPVTLEQFRSWIALWRDGREEPSQYAADFHSVFQNLYQIYSSASKEKWQVS